MLEARSVAVVGASARPGSFGDRVLTELSRSRRHPRDPPRQPAVRRRSPDSRASGRSRRSPGPSTSSCSASATPPSRHRFGWPPPGGPKRRDLRQRRRRRRLAAPAPRRNGCRGGDGGVRGRLYGFRQSGARVAGDRLSRAAPAPRRPDRTRHPFRLGLLGTAAGRPPPWLDRRRVVGAGARDDDGRLPRLRTVAAADRGGRAPARNPPLPRHTPLLPLAMRSRRHPGRGVDRRRLAGRERHGRCPFRRPRRRRRHLGGPL